MRKYRLAVLLLPFFAVPLLAAECAGGSAGNAASSEAASAERARHSGDTTSGAPAAADTAAPGATLSVAQAAKLDPALRKLLGVPGAAQGLFRYSTAERADGATAYAVVLQTSAGRAALREAGVPVTVVTPAGVATAHLTPGQIAAAARLEAVASIRNSADRAPSGSS